MFNWRSVCSAFLVCVGCIEAYMVFNAALVQYLNVSFLTILICILSVSLLLHCRLQLTIAPQEHTLLSILYVGTARALFMT